MLETEGNPIVFDKLNSDPYTRHSMNKVRSACYKIESGILKLAFRSAFKNLNFSKLKPVAFRDKHQIKEKNS